MISIVSTFHKTVGEDVVAGTWHSAAGCLCIEHLGETEITLHFYFFTFHKTFKKEFPKMVKMTKNTLNLKMIKNDQEITYKMFIPVTSSSSPGSI
jgi:hypothetical protein